MKKKIYSNVHPILNKSEVFSIVKFWYYIYIYIYTHMSKTKIRNLGVGSNFPCFQYFGYVSFTFFLGGIVLQGIF